MQHHGNAVLIGEIIEIERIIKALKTNVEKNGAEKTFFHRAEALINFLRLCSTIFGRREENSRDLISMILFRKTFRTILSTFTSIIQTLCD